MRCDALITRRPPGPPKSKSTNIVGEAPLPTGPKFGNRWSARRPCRSLVLPDPGLASLSQFSHSGIWLFPPSRVYSGVPRPLLFSVADVAVFRLLERNRVLVQVGVPTPFQTLLPSALETT